MAEPTTDVLTPAQAYIAGLLARLGSRDPMEVLTETPAAIRAGIAGLTPAQTGQLEAPGKWSVRHLIQHWADSELVGAFRFRMALAHDAPELPGYDQDRWAARLGYQDSDPTTALSEFTAYRTATLRVLRRVTPADLQRVMRHPERGDESVAQMIRIYAGHDLVHLRQLARIRRAIGVTS